MGTRRSVSSHKKAARWLISNRRSHSVIFWRNEASGEQKTRFSMTQARLLSESGCPCVTASPLFLLFLRFFKSEEQELPRGLRYNKGGRIRFFSFIPLTSSASRRGNFSSVLSPLPSPRLHPSALLSTSRRGNFSLFNFLCYFQLSLSPLPSPRRVFTHSTPSPRQLDFLLFISLSFVIFIYLVRLVSSLHILHFPFHRRIDFRHTLRLLGPRLLAESTFSSSAARMLFFPGISAENRR